MHSSGGQLFGSGLIDDKAAIDDRVGMRRQRLGSFAQLHGCGRSDIRKGTESLRRLRGCRGYATHGDAGEEERRSAQ